ncbi:MAG: sugar phosphate permease [Salibacteraceae bacterium]|jgi:sugar phosphate permease
MSTPPKQPIYRILLLILAGEAVFILPFVIARVFRPTFLDVFALNNFELGACFSVYGIVALLSYVYGGAIADTYPPKKLMSSALILTALGGVYMATYPSYGMMRVLFGYWGFTTIFLFWSAMIKATRSWGGVENQGRAFGYLEGGRGFVAATIGAMGVFIFSLFMRDDIQAASLLERQEAFRYVLWFASGLVGFVGLLVFFCMTNESVTEGSLVSNIPVLAHLKEVLKIPSVWLLMAIVLCAYVGYKLTDIFSLYAKEIMLFDEVEAAQVGTFQLYLRPIVCVSIGLLADKSRASVWMIVGFLTLFIGAIIFSSGLLAPTMTGIFILSLVITAAGTYAVRTLYFAAMEEGKIPLAITGTAVGAISVIGYTPDIFVGPIMGYLLDDFPGELGHRYVFMMLAVFSLLGLIAAIAFKRLSALR